LFTYYMTRSTKSAPRSSRLGRRAETADETRRRIVEATYALHSERGIAATSMKDIAERAGVSVGTVYHHFPTYPDAIAACGAFATAHVPAPTAAIFDGAAGRPERVQRLARALFDYYERQPALSSVRRDAHLAEVLLAHAAHEAASRLALAGAALGEASADARSAVAALVDIEVYHSFRRQGFRPASAADAVAALVNAWLDAGTFPAPHLQEQLP
jgi:AcrR family transcriptional regulator